MSKLEAHIENYKYKLNKKIAKLYKYLTIEEYNMLITLNNNCLLIDVDKEMINEEEHITAYNIERKLILLKKYK